ncbi:hypothetical protein, partial [Devosia equisanguinis]
MNDSGTLFLGSDHQTARTLGPRHFRSAAKAVRFAMEHAAPVSLHGALLTIGNRQFGPHQIRRLHAALVAAERPAH